MNQKLLFLVVFIFCGIVARSQLNGNNPVLHSYSSTLNNQWNLPGNGINGLPTGAPNWHAQTIEYGLDGISPCSVVYNTDLSDGLGNLTGLTLAADFPVSADDVFEIQKVHLYLMYDVSQVNLSFYTNSGSLPGTTLMAPNAITPTSKTLVADNVYLVELTLPTPITLEGGPSGSLYWMGVSTTAPSGFSYWMFSETVNNGTNFAGFLGSVWEDVGPYGFPNDGAFILEGNCGTEDDVEGCLNSPNGQWPTTTFTPTCTGLPQTVTSAGYTGEYSNVNVVAGQQYRFTTSSPTDFITISNNDGTVAYAAGTGAVLWTAPTSETIRYYAHLDSDCNYASTIMTRYIACGDIVFPPANDDCANAFAISCGETVTGTTVLATNSGGNAANDVFYKYTGNGTPGEITVSLCGSSYDTYLRVYSDCTLSSQIVFNDDFCAAQSEVTFTSDGTSTYYIMVEGYSSNSGAFTMSVTCDLDEPEGCLTTPNGQWGSLTPVCSGIPETITSAGWTGEYSLVTVTEGVEYIFSSSVSTDFITIANNAGTVVYTAGTGSVTWTAVANENIRFILHNSSACDYESVSRTRYVQCGEPIIITEPDFPCFFGDGLASNGPEDGLNVSTATTFRTADDFTVSDNFTVKQVRFNVLSMTSIVNTVLNFRSNNGGSPGAVIHTVTMAPSSSRIVASAFGYPVHEVTYDLATFIDLAPGTYWFEPQVTNQAGNGSIFWEASSTGTTGAISHQSSDNGTTWTPNEYGYHQIFFVSGDCTPVQEGCLTTPNGQWPSTAYTPSCTGSPETITTAGWTGEYSSVNVTAGVEYIFSSSVTTDFITIANSTGTTAYASGTGSVTWTATANETIRFILHNNSDCAYESVSRTRSVQCGEPYVFDDPDYACYQGDGHITALENGYGILATDIYRVADDFTVDPGTEFTLRQVTMSFLTGSGVTSATMRIHADNAGLPGTELHNFTVSPSYNEIYGSAFGLNAHRVEFPLTTPITLGEGTYWLNVTTPNQTYWVVTTTGTSGSLVALSNTSGSSWSIDTSGYRTVFYVEGDCNAVSEEEPCLTTPNGQWPTTTYTPSCTGSPETITTAGWTGEYSSVNVTAGVEYIFSSSVATDYITIANSSGTVGYATGTGSVTWTASANETIRFILHNNSDCAYESVSRTRSVQCGEPYVFDDPDYACYQGDGHITALENGYGILATDIFRVADDFTVDPGTEFTLRQVTMSMFSSSGITSATMGIHADNGGIPGTELHNFTVTPSYNEIYGSAFGLNAHRVEFPLSSPITLGEGTYWLNVTTPNQTYWMVTSVGTSGSRVATSGTSGSSWSIDSLYRTVFYVEGDCNAVSEEEPCLDTPNGQWGALTPACTGVPEIITSAGWTGEYSWVTVTAGTQYIFSSSINTDFITIANNSGTEAYATGTGSVTWTPTVNETIRFILHNNSDCDYENVSRTRYVLCGDIIPPPSNDDCANAIAVACGDTVTGSTISANNSGGNSAGDVFYKFTGTGTVQQVTVSLCGSSYDTYLRIYSDCTLSNQIAFNDDSCGTQSELTFTSDGTSTYYIMVEGFSSNTGDFVLNITCDDNGSGYCEPELDCTDGDLITNVTFQEIDNDSACSPNGYGNYTHLVATGTAGESYPISVTVGSGWAYESVSVWVDYNNNFVFEQNEFTYIGTGSGSDVVGEITIPAGTADGQYRMRVRVAAVGEGSATWDMACDETQGYGETEDYTLQVGEGSGGGCGVAYVGTIQDGIGNLQTLQIANDFPVAAMTQMTIQQVTMRIFADIGTGSIYIYRDNAGTPGTLEGDALNVTPTSKTFVANVFGYNVYDVVFDLPTPIVVTTGASEELFWVGLTTTAGSEGGSNFWEAADVNTNGLAMVSTDGGVTWAANSFGQDSAFTVTGECQTLGVSDMSSYDFAYYPNPAKDILNISSNKAVQNVQVFNLAGQEVLANGKVMNGQINISTLMTGTYVFRVTLEGGQVETFKIIKK